MDNYIKMCDTDLIQDGWEPKIGDWTNHGLVTGIQYEPNIFNIRTYGGMPTLCPIGDLSYLPSIEQLMGMVKHKDYWYVQHDNFDRYVVILKPDYKKQFTSYKEAWLAFAMHELHGKKWDGERWE